MKVEGPLAYVVDSFGYSRGNSQLQFLWLEEHKLYDQFWELCYSLAKDLGLEEAFKSNKIIHYEQIQSAAIKKRAFKAVVLSLGGYDYVTTLIGIYKDMRGLKSAYGNRTRHEVEDFHDFVFKLIRSMFTVVRLRESNSK